MNIEKTIIYKPHVVASVALICLTVFLCVGSYFFFEFKKEDSKCTMEIKAYDLRIKEIEKELKENGIPADKSADSDPGKDME